MSKKEQTSLEKAFLDFKNLKEHAKKELMNQLEEKVENKILALINEMDESQNSEKLEEGTTITIDIDGDQVDVGTSENTEETFEEEIELETSAEDDDIFEFTSDAESYQIDNDMNLEEQEPVAPAPVDMGAPAPGPEMAEPEMEAPAPEMAEPAGGGAESKIIDGIKELISQGGGADMGAMDDSGEIDIVDDAGAAPAPQPQQPVAEDFDADEIFEIIEEFDEDMSEDSGLGWDDIYNNVSSEEEEDELFEITLDEDDDESEEPDLEEMKAMGQGHGIRRTAGKGAGPKVAVDNRSRQAVRESNSQAESRYKAHKEAKIAELNEENESLKAKIDEQKKEIEKFHNSFVELRSQFNEMQTFNAKLAYANKLFANGGFSEKEKLQIAESFDKTKTADEAKKLYNSIISENKLSVKDIQKEIAATPSKVAKPQASQHNVLYESAEVKRMRQLAGLNRSES